MRLVKKLFLIILILLFPSISICGTYYVEPQGSLALDKTDEGATAWSDAININTPTSAMTAFNRAIAGDTIYFRGGTYQAGQHTIGSLTPVYYPTNSGTNGNPITFIAYPSETPVFNGTVTQKVTGTAGAGTENNTLVDSTKDFVALGIIPNTDIIRTENTSKGGAWVIGVTDSHTLDLTHASHNTMNGFQEGDWYEIGRDYTLIMGIQDAAITNYITFDGFTFQSDNGNELGTLRLNGIDISNRSFGNIVKNCIFVGPSVKKIVHGDNREFIRIEKQSNVLIQRCSLSHLNHMREGINDGSTTNTSGMKVYYSQYLTFENNEVFQTAGGIFLKQGANDVIIRYNYLYSNKVGLLLNYTSYNLDRVSIYHNIIVNSSEPTNMAAGIYYVAINDTRHGDDISVYNNTFYNFGRFGVRFHPNQSGHGLTFYNNIVINNLQTYQWYTFNTGSHISGSSLTYLKEMDHNQWGGTPWKNIYISENYQSRTYTSLATWQASTELESAVNVGCGSNQNPGCGDLSSDPLFVNSSGNMNILADFALQTGSPCKGAGRGGVDMGADISLVGPNVETGSATWILGSGCSLSLGSGGSLVME